MSNKWLRLANDVVAAGVFAWVVWFCSSAMHASPFSYVLTINFAIMGFVWFVFDIHKPSFSSSWFDSKTFERGGRVYGLAGVIWFMKAQQKVGWNRLLGVQSLSRKIEDWELREWGTRFGEATHWVCLVILIPIAIWSVILLEGIGLIFWVGSAIVFHLYPIMLQRYLRPRFRRLLDKVHRGAV